ncbi:MAG: GTPase HflX, partial [Candidatus Eremiobacteraeota bacterium]|nr:GTPase HflX [Candidatus Eremiobacteraeota bacterium]
RVLKERLEGVQRSREVQRASRRSAFRAALVGYTNAGKSSIMRGLSGAADVFVEDRLFATLDPLTREAQVGAHARVLVTDTVGFIRKLPHHLVASFRATLEETREADLLLHVIDASHPGWEAQRAVVEEVLAEIGVRDTPVLYVFNKIDALDADVVEAMRVREAQEGTDAVFVSAHTPGGLQPLADVLAAREQARYSVVDVHLSSSDGRELAELYRDAEVLEQRQDDEALVVRARVGSRLLGQLRERGRVA